MDSFFHLGEGERAAFLRQMMQSFRSTYICLWSYSPFPSNCLLFLDGFYLDEKIQQPSSSSGSLAATLFDAYCGSGHYIDDGRVPGFAFRNNLPYFEMQAEYLHTIVSSQLQLQFYQEAGIKTTVFMGCAMGEIELGFSTQPLVNLQMEIQSMFPSDFCREIPHPTNNESIKYFDTPDSSFTTYVSTESLVLEDSASPLISTIPRHQSSLIPNQQFPPMKAEEDEAITSAILAVLSSSSNQTPQNPPPTFSSYRAALAPVSPPSHKPSLLKKAVSFFKNLDMDTRRELQIQGNQATVNQMHHMIAERRRREKLNESFQILKTLLPQVTKKDKASVLSSTTEYLSSLKSQLGELTRRNAALEKQLSTAKGESGEDLFQGGDVVEIDGASPSTSEARFFNLRMSSRSEERRLTDFVARVLEFLKKNGNVSLLSVKSSTRIVDSTPVHTLVMILKAEGIEFDETGFQEAVRRVVDDLPH